MTLDGDIPADIADLAGTLALTVGFSPALMAPLILGFAAVYGLYGLGRLTRLIPAPPG